jgi:RNA-directed DNA polymerase
MGWILQEPGRTGDRPTFEIAEGTAAESGTGPARKSPPCRSERGEARLERGSEYISDPVVGTGSLSALIVLLTLGNVARMDPTEGSGVPL